MRYFSAKRLLLLGIVVILLPTLRATVAETAPASMCSATLHGHIETAATLVRVAAVDRQWADVLKTSLAAPEDPFFYEGSVDSGSGNFHIDHLLPGRTYDLIVWTRGGDYHALGRGGDGLPAADQAGWGGDCRGQEVAGAFCDGHAGVL